ncbi:hypothetical protein NS365_13585 [Aureimonas ureilytica]|uniref:Uncharacterized protein n=1 Tax=Aureimonas ureilytica TaxID=401562 RepID=A0A175RQA4_9HYPH|nr:hypothetical protein NS365_13585 [Aureimonas ureilytica]
MNLLSQSVDAEARGRNRGASHSCYGAGQKSGIDCAIVQKQRDVAGWRDIEPPFGRKLRQNRGDAIVLVLSLHTCGLDGLLRQRVLGSSQPLQSQPRASKTRIAVGWIIRRSHARLSHESFQRPLAPAEQWPNENETGFQIAPDSHSRECGAGCSALNGEPMGFDLVVMVMGCCEQPRTEAARFIGQKAVARLTGGARNIPLDLPGMVPDENAMRNAQRAA